MNLLCCAGKGLCYFAYILLARNFSYIQFARKHHCEDNVIMNVLDK